MAINWKEAARNYQILTESGAAYEVVREVKRRIWGILQTVAEVAA